MGIEHAERARALVGTRFRLQGRGAGGIGAGDKMPIDDGRGGDGRLAHALSSLFWTAPPLCIGAVIRHDPDAEAILIDGGRIEPAVR